MNALYRFRQGIRALISLLRPVDDMRAARILTPALFDLYRRMRRSERQHSLRILRSLIDAGHTNPDLLAAALLHDVGKIRAPFYLPEKVLVVLIKATAPTLYQEWGHRPAHGWRRPFAIAVQHPMWGADMVAAAGGSPLTVDLIRRHADVLDGTDTNDADLLLRALQAVDDLN